jgi:hypothetical protein
MQRDIRRAGSSSARDPEGPAGSAGGESFFERFSLLTEQLIEVKGRLLFICICIHRGDTGATPHGFICRKPMEEKP